MMQIGNIPNFNIKNYPIKFGHIISNNEKLSYPINFDIINEEIITANKIDLKDNNITDIIKKIERYIINGGLLLELKNNNCINDKKYLIYLYSNQDNNSFEPIAINEWKKGKDKDKAINLLNYLSKNNDIIKNPQVIQKEIAGKIHIIKNENNKFNTIKEIKSNSKQQKKYLDREENQNQVNEENLNYNLAFAIDLLKEKNYISQIINQKFQYNKNRQNEKYYLINKNYIKEIEIIFKLNEINQMFIKYQDKNDKIILDGIKSTLSNDTKKVLNKLNNDKIQEILESKKFTQFHLDYVGIKNFYIVKIVI